MSLVRPAGRRPLLAFTQGDPAGIGPELLLRLVARGDDPRYRVLLLAERAGLAAVRESFPSGLWERLAFLDGEPAREEILGSPGVPVLDPVGDSSPILPGRSGPREATGAKATLDRGIELARSGTVDALVTLPVSKATIAGHLDPSFRGHTDYLAAACGLERYGRDYLMAFLAPGLRVALLTVHLSLREALDRITEEALVEALECLARHGGGTIAVPGVNPHAGEGGLLGTEEQDVVAPALARARERGIEVRGPESPDSIFGRAREGLVDWVLALYHDQGLIAVKTAARAKATNWTLGLPFLRTSVDHGTAFDIAGKGLADPSSLFAVVEETLRLVAGRR